MQKHAQRTWNKRKTKEQTEDPSLPDSEASHKVTLLKEVALVHTQAAGWVPLLAGTPFLSHVCVRPEHSVPTEGRWGQEAAGSLGCIPSPAKALKETVMGTLAWEPP